MAKILIQPLLVSWGRNFHLEDMNSTVSFNCSKKGKCLQHRPMFKLLNPQAASQTVTLCIGFIKHWTICDSSQGMEMILMSMICSFFFFLRTKWFQLNKEMKGIKFQIFAKWCSLRLTYSCKLYWSSQE